MIGVRSFPQMLYSVYKEYIAFEKTLQKSGAWSCNKTFVNKTKFTALVVVS